MKLSGGDRYNPDKIPELEKYVLEEAYDLDANLALLRLYSFAPRRASPRFISIILAKAMTQLPSLDFSLYLHLIPQRLQGAELIPALIALNQYLEGGNYPTFWHAIDSCKDLLRTVPGFQESIRSYIIYSIESSSQKVAKQVLSTSLGLDPAGLDNLIASKGWKTVQSPIGPVVSLPVNDQNNIKPQAAQSGFRFEQLAPLLAAA